MITKDINLFTIVWLDWNEYENLCSHIGNILYVNANTVRIADLWKKIYNKETIEISKEEVKEIIDILKNPKSWLFPIVYRELENFLLS